MLFSSGLIAGGAITGVVLAALTVTGVDASFNMTERVGAFGTSAIVALVIYVVLLSIPLYRVAIREEPVIGS